MGLIHGGRELLGLEETARLQGAHGSIFALGHIEDHGMGMKLRRCISVHRTGGVMLECRGDKLPGSLRRMVAADACLGIVLQLVKSEGNGLPMCFPNLVIAAHESRQRDRFRRGEGGVPTCAMLNGRHSPPVFRLVFMDGTVPDELFAGRRMLTLGETGELQQRLLLQRVQTLRRACHAIHPEWCLPASNSSAPRR